MSQIILLNDATYHKHPLSTRPAGGHAIASALRSGGFECEVIDWFTSLPDFFDILRNVSSEDTKILAISSTFLAPASSVGENKAVADMTGFGVYKDENVDDASFHAEAIYDRNLYMWLETKEKAEEWFKKVREILPNVSIIMGGPRVARIFKILEKKYIEDLPLREVEYFIVGEGDDAVLKIADKIINGKNNFLKTLSINNLNFVFANRYDKPIPPITYTKNTFAVKGEWLPLEVSRGCKFNCSFCNFEKNVYRKKDRKTLIDELTRNYEMFGTQGYHITSDCLNDSKQYVDIFTDAIKSLNFKIEYASYSRLDLFHKYDDMMDQLLETGYKAGWFGIETFNHEAGKAARKGLNPDRVKELLHIFKERSEKYGGFWLSVYLVLGLPKETVESTRDTINWFVNNKIIDEVSVSVLDIAEFSELLVDMTSFSEHSTNPEKFGLTELSYNPFFWKHDTMDLNQAIALKQEFKEKMINHKVTRFGGGAQNEYGSIRTLGFTHDQTVKLLKTKLGKAGANLINVDKNLKKSVRNQIISISQEKLKKYNDSMLSLFIKNTK